MLTETEAWALLQRHCRPLSDIDTVDWVGFDFDRHCRWADVAREHVDLLVHSSSPVTTHSVGARLRLALGVAHAVSCCRGFEPATHQAFWRRVVAQLWPGYHAKIFPAKLAFSNTTFAHMAIEWARGSRQDDPFWIGFLHGTPEFDAKLSEVHEILTPYFATGSAPPPLRVSLLCCTSNKTRTVKNKGLPDTHTMDHESTVQPLVVKTILRAALEPPQPTTWSVPTQLGLVVEYRVDDRADATREMLDLMIRAQTLERPQLPIERLAIQLVPPKPPRHAEPGELSSRALVTRGRALGAFLRAMLVDAGVRVHTVALFGCSHTDYRLVGAALSAVPHASPAIRGLRCSGLGHTSQLGHQLLRLAWLVYALLRRPSQSPLSLSLLSCGVAMNDHERAYMNALVTNGTPLRDVVGDALRMRYGDTGPLQRVDWLQLGSTVRLGRGTRLYYEPVADTDHIDDEWVVVTLWDTDDADEVEVDAVAHVVDRGVVAVVYAGYGLLWADASRVAVWQRVPAPNDDDVHMADDDDTIERTGVALSSLALSFDCARGDLPTALAPFAHRVAAMVPLLASATLEALVLDRAVVLHDDLTTILDCLPRLHSLVLDRCVVESLAPLLDAYTRKRTRVAMLSLVGARDLRLRNVLVDAQALLFMPVRWDPLNRRDDAPAWVAPTGDALASGIARDVLRELHVDCTHLATMTDEWSLIERLAHAVQTSALQLTRLHVTCHQKLQDTCVALLGPLRDTVLADPPRVRRAVLSVLRAFRCAVPEVALAVLTLAEGSVVRTVTWDWKSKQ